MTRASDTREIFGTAAGGESVYRLRLTGGGLTANIMTWGATLQDLRLEGHDAPLVLGFDRFDHYPAYSPFFGATPGRFANRIANGQFTIDGVKHQTNRNFLDKHTLHGGAEGIGKRNWQIADLGTSHVILTITDPDGAMGFPGTCQHICTYTLKHDGTLQIVFTTRTDATTIASLAHHSYFSLDDGGDCRDTVLQIDANHYLPVNEELIPTGEIRPVDGSPFDFRNPKRIGTGLTGDLIYDHNFCLADARRGLRQVASAQSSRSGIELTVATTEPGLQFYAGHKVDTPVSGLTGQPYSSYAGFCLETQIWPDAPNHETFPNAVLRPGEESRQVTEYRFTKN